MQIITISGIDGSGKSTQLKTLKAYLEEKNKKIASFHAVNFSLVNNILKKKKEKTENKIKEDLNENLEQSSIFEQPAKAVTSGNFFTIFARKIILIIDILRFKKYKAKLISQGIDYLLVDRYFYDQIINIFYLSYKKKIINIAINSNKAKVPIRFSPLLKLAVKITPRPSHSFFIDVTPQIAMDRDRDIEQGQEYLTIKRSLYKKFVKQFNMQIIDGNNEVENVQNRILKKMDI